MHTYRASFRWACQSFFFLKHSVSNAGKIHLFLNRHAFGVCHTLSSCSQTESNRRALKYSILFCHIFFCYPMFYSNTTGSQLIFSSQTTKDGQGFIWLHTNRCLVSLIYILTQREQNSNQIYIFYYAPFPYALCWVSQGVGGCICWDSRSVY